MNDTPHTETRHDDTHHRPARTPVESVLFEEAAKASPETSPVLASLSEDEFTRFLRSKTGYLDLYGQLKDVPLEISRETGTLLYMLARSSRARNIVEFGTSFGISTLHLAAALRDNGGGRLITTEFEPSKVARARENLTAGGVIDLVEIRVGDALETTANNYRKASSCCCSTATRLSISTS